MIVKAWLSIGLFALVITSCSSASNPLPQSAATQGQTGTIATATQPPPTTLIVPTSIPENALAQLVSTRVIETAPAVAEAIPPTPVCSAGLQPTPPMTEGPYYKPNTPEGTSLLEPRMEGTRLVITGYVLTTNCQPVPGAFLDFWQADDKGVYDNAGYRMRGHQFTDENGRYYLETVLPGLYPGRTRHIHVKVQAPGGPMLTSQLFFPGETGNQTDNIFDPALQVNIQETPQGLLGTFNFVIPGH